MHYEADVFDDELSQRTLDNFIKTLDPGKLYFLESDVEGLRDSYGTRLDDLARASSCSALNAVLGSYANRFTKRQPTIRKWIDAAHDFSIDESLEIDRKKREFATDETVMEERWRRRIKYQLLNLKQTLGEIGEAREKLHKRYDLGEKYLSELDSMEIASIFLNAFSTALDPHSSYYSPDALEDFRIATSLSLEGIGAVLRSEYGMTKVQKLMPGGPAEKSGLLKVNDKIITVTQADGESVDVIDMKLRDVVKHIRGQRGTEVLLTVVREEMDKTVRKEIPIVRDKIVIKDGEAKAYTYPVQVHEDPNNPRQYLIGVIRLPSFYIDFSGRKNGETDYKSCSADVRRLIEKLKDEEIDAVVMDIRNNSGGSLDEAVAIAGLFFDRGPVVQVENTGGGKQVLADTDSATYYDGPLMVLINRNSASSSEIFSGAIQDYGRGIIVGDSHTFGKGTVQNVREVRNGELGAIKVTISQFFRPGGSSTQLRGVLSDIVLPDIVDEYKVGEKFYDYALPWKKIEEASFARFNLVDNWLEPLRAASESRVQADPDFHKIMEDINEFRAKEATRTLVSLKEEEKEDEEEHPDSPLLAEESLETGEDEDVNGDDALVTENDLGEETEAVIEEEEVVADEDAKPSLEKDSHLRETLAVIADYLQVLQKKELAEVSYPELEDINIAMGVKDASALAEEGETSSSQ